MQVHLLCFEAYGTKTTAADITRFVEANMNLMKLDGTLPRAITDTHTGYFKAGAVTQDLIREQYPYPAALKRLGPFGQTRVDLSFWGGL